MWRMFRHRKWQGRKNRKLGFVAFTMRGRQCRPPDGDEDGDVGGSGGSGSVGGDGDGDPGTDGAESGSGGGAGSGKTFTQDDLNRIIKKENDKKDKAWKGKLQEQLAKVNKLTEEKDLTAKQRESLMEQKASLETALMSKEEEALAAKAKSDKDHAAAVEGLTTERNEWQGRYEAEVISTAILKAADAHEAFNNSQLVALVSPLTSVEPIKNEKEEVIPGKFHPVVTAMIKDEEGNVAEKQLSIDKYVEYLRGQKDYENLFVSKRPGGTGHRQGSGGGSKGSAEMSATEKIASGLDKGQANRTGPGVKA